MNESQFEQKNYAVEKKKETEALEIDLRKLSETLALLKAQKGGRPEIEGNYLIELIMNLEREYNKLKKDSSLSRTKVRPRLFFAIQVLNELKQGTLDKFSIRQEVINTLETRASDYKILLDSLKVPYSQILKNNRK